MEQDNTLDTRSLDYGNWAQQSSLLDEQNRKEPIESLMDICCQRTLFEVRVELWDIMVEIMGVETFLNGSPLDVSDRIWHFQQFHVLYELVYRIKQLVDEKKLIYQYNP